MRFRVEKGESFARVHRESSYLRFIERGSAFGREKEASREGDEEPGWMLDRLTADSRIIDINRDCIVTSNAGGGVGRRFAALIIPGRSARGEGRGGEEARPRTISPRPELLGISEFFRRLV